MTILNASWKSSAMTIALVASIVLPACAGTEHDPKPQQDPDLGILDSKSDGLSNRFTTIVGEIVPTMKVTSEIDWPDWFHGYTVQLEAGSTMEIEVDSSAVGPFRVYGPSHRTGRNGRPLFRRAIAADFTELYAGRYISRFNLEIEESGTYLVVYGPAYEWSADYIIGVRCAEGCRLPDQCFDDTECSPGEFCGDNGVRCITAPCDANYSICQPSQDDGAWCERESMCSSGVCESETCGAQSECTADAECEDSFCGWAEDNFGRLCKAYSQAGERCGGFVLPSSRSQCAPSLGCVFPEPTNDVPGTCQ